MVYKFPEQCLVSALYAAWPARQAQASHGQTTSARGSWIAVSSSPAAWIAVSSSPGWVSRALLFMIRPLHWVVSRIIPHDGLGNSKKKLFGLCRFIVMLFFSKPHAHVLMQITK